MLSFPFAFTLVSCPAFQLVAVKPSTLLQEDPRSLEQPALDRRTSLAKFGTCRKHGQYGYERALVWESALSCLMPLASSYHQPNRYTATFLCPSYIFHFLHAIISSLRILRDEESENETILEEPVPETVRRVL